MRRLVALFTAGCAGHAPAHQAPDVAAVALDGTPLRLSALRGRRVVLDFWETTCAPCARAVPVLADLAARYPGLAIVSITPEHPSAELRAFVAEHGMTWTIATDESDAVGAAFRVVRYPTYFLIDEAGTIACAACTLDELERAVARSPCPTAAASARTSPSCR